MTDASVRDRKPEPLHRRTYSKVRAKEGRSKRAGGEIRTRLNWDEVRRRKRIVRAFAATTARDGRRAGSFKDGHACLSPADVRLYEEHLEMNVLFEGRVEPSLREIGRRVHGRKLKNPRVKNVVGGHKRLEAHGLLEHDRRYVETGEDGVRGPVVVQTTNFYRLPQLPQRVLLAVATGKARRVRTPGADDDDQRRSEAEATYEDATDAATDSEVRAAEAAAHAEIRHRDQLRRGIPARAAGPKYATPAEAAAAALAEAERLGLLSPEPEPPPKADNVIPLRGRNPAWEPES